MKCSNCGTEVAVNMKFCPTCGCAIDFESDGIVHNECANGNNAKDDKISGSQGSSEEKMPQGVRTALIVVLLLVTVGIVIHFGQSNYRQEEPVQLAEEEEVSYTEWQMNTDLSLADIKIRVNRCYELNELVDPSGFFESEQATENSKFVVVEFTVENTTKNKINDFDIDDFELIDGEERVFQTYEDGYSLYFDHIIDSTLAPGIAETGVAVYNLPSVSTDYYILAKDKSTGEDYHILLEPGDAPATEVEEELSEKEIPGDDNWSEGDNPALEYAGCYEGIDGHTIIFSPYATVQGAEVGTVDVIENNSCTISSWVYLSNDWVNWIEWRAYDAFYSFDDGNSYLGFYTENGVRMLDYNGFTHNIDILEMKEHY